MTKKKPVQLGLRVVIRLATLQNSGSVRTFPDDPLSRRRLYTTVSRATRKLTLLVNGKLTPLLSL